MNKNTEGFENSAHGSNSLFSNTTGVCNTAVGTNACYNNTTGSYNTAIGLNAGPNASGYSNTGAFGRGATTTASNQYRIGNSGVTSIGGYQNWTNISDGRFKKDVSENVAGLDFILKLRPVTYRLNVSQLNSVLGYKEGIDDPSFSEQSNYFRTGFIAQEVEWAANSLDFNFSGVDLPKNENDLYGLRYAEFVVPLVKAVQEQQVIIEELKKENADLKAQHEEILKRLEALEGR